MPAKSSGKVNKIIIFSIIIILTMAGAIGVSLFMKSHSNKMTGTSAPENRISIKAPPLIDYNTLEKDEALKAMMQRRKEKYGLEKGVNIIARPDESLKIGNSTVTMREILDSIHLDKGNIIEGNLLQPGDVPGSKTAVYTDTNDVYGIYIVQPGDNIWNIHYRFLKSYFGHRGIALSPVADEPDIKGHSSGVGKILKFSETMVYIYNVKDRKLEADIHLIYPLSKIVVFNMKELFTLLDQIDYPRANHIQFDGETIWIPTEQ
ncbi:MAG: hypothetical protein PHP23_01425 [Desulfobacterales bacterium]|nr:hypothetical protein [Desulfobacterales bacterium]MDD4072283.1 hypothetical protein [Desulfobacterales bacterium]MDD4392694.1 hypothetical protein [Desulfobacterales bacterium]